MVNKTLILTIGQLYIPRQPSSECPFTRQQFRMKQVMMVQFQVALSKQTTDTYTVHVYNNYTEQNCY